MKPYSKHEITSGIIAMLVGSFAFLSACSDDAQVEEVCPSNLTTCSAGADEVCTNTDYDPSHCGACGNVCGQTGQAIEACLEGQCVTVACEAGYDDCNDDLESDGCETDLSNSVDNCGACGNQCFASTQMCENGLCVDDPNQSTEFYLDISSLDTAGCSAVEHTATSGQDRGGLAVGQNSFYYMGSTDGARINLEDPNTVSAVTLQYSIFSDLASGTLYAFTVNGSAIAPDCDNVIDGFVQLDPNSLAPSGDVISLSSPITWTCELDNGGVFSGRGQVLLHDSQSRTYAITLPDGTVTDMGTMANLEEARACANWALYGVAEAHDDDIFMVYRSDNPDAIVRHSVSTGDVETIVDLNGINVRNLCNIGVDLPGNRWVWHYQGSGDLDELVAPFQVAGTCPATFDVPPAP